MSITFLIPVFNEAKTVKKAIEETIQLNIPNKEIIIIDNGSTDGTQDIIKEFINSKNVKIILKKKKPWFWKFYKRRIFAIFKRIYLSSIW